MGEVAQAIIADDLATAQDLGPGRSGRLLDNAPGQREVEDALADRRRPR